MPKRRNTNVKGIAAFLAILTAPVAIVLNAPHYGGSIDQAIANVQTAREAGHVFQIKADCFSACGVWSTYERACLGWVVEDGKRRRPVIGVHYAFFTLHGPAIPVADGDYPVIQVPSLRGTLKLRAHLTPTLQAALDLAWDQRREGNPFINIPGSKLIERGEVKACEVD